MTEIDISTLNAQQIKDLRKQLKAATSQTSDEIKSRNTLIDNMLQEKDGDAFKHTTGEILAELVKQQHVPADYGTVGRKEWLKRIQTRKQKLVKQGVEAGYRATMGGFGLTAESVTDWIIENGNTLSDNEKKAILKSIA